MYNYIYKLKTVVTKLLRNVHQFTAFIFINCTIVECYVQASPFNQQVFHLSLKKKKSIYKLVTISHFYLQTIWHSMKLWLFVFNYCTHNIVSVCQLRTFPNCKNLHCTQINSDFFFCINCMFSFSGVWQTRF